MWENPRLLTDISSKTHETINIKLGAGRFSRSKKAEIGSLSARSRTYDPVGTTGRLPLRRRVVLAAGLDGPWPGRVVPT